MKGSKHHRWYKDGIKTSRKWYKNIWNKKVRHDFSIGSHSNYKKFASVSMWVGMP